MESSGYAQEDKVRELSWRWNIFQITLLNTKRNLLYIRSQFVPRSKHFQPLL